MEEKKFVTREYLIKNGFERDTTSPLSVEDYFVKVRSEGGYIKFRFLPDEEIARGLYAYAENYDHANVRKVVLSDTKITIREFEIAVELCFPQ